MQHEVVDLSKAGERDPIDCEHTIASGETGSVGFLTNTIEGLPVVVEVKRLVRITAGVEELFMQGDHTSDVIDHATAARMISRTYKPAMALLFIGELNSP